MGKQKAENRAAKRAQLGALRRESTPSPEAYERSAAFTGQAARPRSPQRRDRIRRRDLLGSLFAVVALWPRAARAQQARLPVVGFLNAATPTEFANRVAAFVRGLNEAGFVEPRNVRIEYRWAEGRYEQLPALAADLVRRGVDILVATGGTPSARAAQSATRTIPVVFVLGGDPTQLGRVASLSRPGSNMTGVSLLLDELSAKRFELTLDLVPKAAAIAMLVNPNNPATEIQVKNVEEAARARKVQLRIVSASNEREIESAFAGLARQRPDALVFGTDPYFESLRHRLISLTARHRLPAVYFVREFAADGGLASYGVSISDAYRQAGLYVGRILDGAKPAELPVIQLSKFELVINLKAAKALGLTVPPTLLTRADEVIE